MKRKKKSLQQPIAYGVAWFNEEDWARLLEISNDRDTLENSHSEWLRYAEETVRKLDKQGLEIQKVTVVPDELLSWCNERSIPVDGEARTGYVCYRMQQEDSEGV